MQASTFITSFTSFQLLMGLVCLSSASIKKYANGSCVVLLGMLLAL